eukprot:scaffold50918_cov63-Cyclotella_meneghiniana.AAC.2
MSYNIIMKRSINADNSRRDLRRPSLRLFQDERSHPFGTDNYCFACLAGGSRVFNRRIIRGVARWLRIWLQWRYPVALLRFSTARGTHTNPHRTQHRKNYVDTRPVGREPRVAL